MTRKVHTPLTIADSDAPARIVCAGDGDAWPCATARKRGENAAVPTTDGTGAPVPGEQAADDAGRAPDA